MNLDKKLFFLVLLMMFVVFTASASYKIVLQSGHDGMPVEMQWHKKTNTIVSVGEDGRLIVTRPSDRKVLHRFRVSEDRIYNLELDPSDKKAAVVTSSNGIYTISVWDWDLEEKIFDYEINSEPLFTSWSAKGRYLTVGNLGSPSILVLDGRTGRKLSYLQRLPSLYNAGYIGSTETILMTYAVSGSIRYWDIRSSALKLSTETLANLQDIEVLQTDSKTTLFGRIDDTLYLINRQTGTVLDQLEIPDISDVSIDVDSGELDVLVVSIAGTFLQEYKVIDQKFLPRDFGESNFSSEASPLAVDNDINPVKVLRKAGRTYLFSRSGKLYEKDTKGFSPLIDDKLWQPDSMAFNDASFFLSRGNRILRFTSLFFSNASDGNIDELKDVTREEIATGSSATKTGIEILPGNIVLQWDRSTDGNNSGIRRLSFNNPKDEVLFPEKGSFEKLTVLDDGRLLTVNRNGTVNIINSTTGEVKSSYSALGILDSAYSQPGNFILTGRSSQGSAGTALERIDVQTKESVPVPDERFMVYSIVAGPSGLYSTGIKNDSRGNRETTILRHNLENPEETRKIFSVNKEDLNAAVLPDPESHNTIFTSLGGTVRRISGYRKTVFQWNEEVSYLALRYGVLYGLDADGALVLWNATTGQPLIKVFFFENGGWIAIPPDENHLWASPGAINNVLIYKDGRIIDPSRVTITIEEKDSESYS